MSESNRAVAPSAQGENEWQPMSLLERSEFIYESARRLRKFCQLKAPAIVIEQERAILLRKLINFPAPPEQIEARERIAAMVEEAELIFLRDHGFYKDVFDDSDGEPT